jgi:hypothetical protein
MASFRHWTSNNSVTITIPFTISGPTDGVAYTSESVSRAVSTQLSGPTVIGGTMVQVSAFPIYIPPNVATIARSGTVNVVTTNGSYIDPAGNPRSAIMDGVGGENLQMAPGATSNTVVHELGHAAGADDQYAGGVALGAVLAADVPGPNNLMKNADGSPANQQTLREVVNTPTRNSATCATGVVAPNGDC